mgnify:FL=1
MIEKIITIFLTTLLLSCQTAIISTGEKPYVEETAIVQHEELSSYIMVAEATYYTHTGNLTSRGTYPREGRTIAVDPDIIPYGSELIIDGVGGYVAEDCGGDIQGNRIDIFLDSEEACYEAGRRNVNVEVIL